jgi:hypothetical protein
MISWRRLFRRGQSDTVLQQEIELHLAEEIAENIERGIPADEARRQAFLKFGSPRRVREELWQQNSFAVVDTFWRDMRQVLRRLERSPSVVLTVMISLGLGIAANVFIFSAVNKLLLQEPPVGHPATLLNIYSVIDHGQRTGPSSLTTFNDLHDQAKSFSGVAAYNNFLPATIAGPGEPERVWGQSATTNFFDVAELPMALGRGFQRGEDRSPVIVLTYGLWRRHFGGDPAILGKPVSLSGKIFTVIGVTMPGFRGIHRLFNIEFWVPQGEREQLAADKVSSMDPREVVLLDVVARLKPGVSRAQAQVELDAMARRFAAAYPKEDEGLGFHIESRLCKLSDGADGGRPTGVVHCQLECRELAAGAGGGAASGDGGAHCPGSDSLPPDTAHVVRKHVDGVVWRCIWSRPECRRASRSYRVSPTFCHAVRS